MKIIIAEDEPLAAEQLKQFIQSYSASMNVIKTFSSCKELRKWMQSGEDIDFLFCDIELSDGNVLNSLSRERFDSPVIFTTAYDHFWSKALKLNGIDYLLKPLSQAKVHAVLDKAASLKKKFSRDSGKLAEITDLLSRQQSFFYKKRFSIRLNNEVFVLETTSVVFFRITDGLIFAHTDENKKYPLVEETLGDLETKLDPELFFRINRSEIINVGYLLSIRINEGNDYSVSLKGIKEKLTVSNSRISGLKDWLDNPKNNPAKSNK